VESIDKAEKGAVNADAECDGEGDEHGEGAVASKLA
jgi:hypothetical protein